MRETNYKNMRQSRATTAPLLELLEDRRLMSASGLSDVLATPFLNMAAHAAGGAVYGLSPAQVQSAYAFNQVLFQNGTVAGKGAGQTIAIVDAYNDPNIAVDLQKFDAQFGVRAPSGLAVVSQTGSTTKLPANNANWAMEEALDVEWAHAIAPKASILLVEANSASFSDLLTAVDFARNATGVSVVSMSWGSGEFSGEAGFNSYFTTPANHIGVTFVASSGDSGSSGGASFPAVVPSVLAVGGTTLNLNSAGAYAGETGWTGSGGGVSKYESTPGYQSGAQGAGHRTSPDVSYDANPNSGFAVYDSYGAGNSSPWVEVGGTSAGAPQWAALVAIANQGRAANGLGTLDGLTGTLPALYSLYSNPSQYSSSFNDVLTGKTSATVSAGRGYDQVSGLGTPQASSVVQALVGAGSVTGAAKPAAAGLGGSPAASRHASLSTVAIAPAAAVHVEAHATLVGVVSISGPAMGSLWSDDAVAGLL